MTAFILVLLKSYQVQKIIYVRKKKITFIPSMKIIFLVLGASFIYRIRICQIDGDKKRIEIYVKENLNNFFLTFLMVYFY